MKNEHTSSATQLLNKTREDYLSFINNAKQSAEEHSKKDEENEENGTGSETSIEPARESEEAENKEE